MQPGAERERQRDTASLSRGRKLLRAWADYTGVLVRLAGADHRRRRRRGVAVISAVARRADARLRRPPPLPGDRLPRPAPPRRRRRRPWPDHLPQRCEHRLRTARVPARTSSSVTQVSGFRRSACVFSSSWRAGSVTRSEIRAEDLGVARAQPLHAFGAELRVRRRRRLGRRSRRGSVAAASGRQRRCAAEFRPLGSGPATGVGAARRGLARRAPGGGRAARGGALRPVAARAAAGGPRRSAPALDRRP